jgi:hypothetical protein
MRGVGVNSATPGETVDAVRPEPVEGLSCSCGAEKEGKGFDKLSPNGFGIPDVGTTV